MYIRVDLYKIGVTLVYKHRYWDRL